LRPDFQSGKQGKEDIRLVMLQVVLQVRLVVLQVRLVVLQV
jgi:hypothetical protein